MMGRLTIRLAYDQHARLKRLAESRGISLNKLFEEFSTRAIAELDPYTRFLAQAARGDTQRAVDTLDLYFEK